MLDCIISGSHEVALRALKVAEETWETGSTRPNHWLSAAVKFADEFEGWRGFGTAEDEAKMGYPEKQ
jgi:hypothetical protein